MFFFKKKDRNVINGGAISDLIIVLNLNLMGQSKKFVEDYFREHLTEFTEDNRFDDIIMFFANLNNGCIVGISIQNDHVYKVNIYLNNKPSEADLQNLNYWTLVNNIDSEKYLFYSKLESLTKKYYICFESKIY